MENASKALIIAGAIIISILVIGLGVFIFSGASENADVSSSMNSQKAQAHNGTFTNYFGQRVSASKVKELMKQVVTNNITADTADEKARIFIKFTPVDPDTGKKRTIGETAWRTTTYVTEKVRSGYTYEVSAYSDSLSDVGEKNASNDGPTNTNDTAGYYKSGYLRVIAIIENEKG